ncbi:unnamed protein product [Brassicogethes aeneus]|uniref:Mitogen-activated protein kinase kinase kinase 4 n=1 Tax=Brassicogethes aeneus TaxID=1431903 RepID=A0A9P0FJ59_BRAAE|nr:unnamed protein product [Brassicogethes aeneus]
MEEQDIDDLGDVYGKTPPRTKILRKNREKKQKEKGYIASPKIKSPISRRNTASNIYDELLAKAENSDGEEVKRTNKRSLKLLRGSERDLKLDIVSAQALTSKVKGHEEPTTPIPSYQIEGCNRFLSLSCRTTKCQRSQSVKKLPSSPRESRIVIDSDEENQKRLEFYADFKALIKVGIADKIDRNSRRGFTREETLWQNELKDLIWLELQAFHADRSPIDQDTYLCWARESVACILSDIINYRFERNFRRLSTNTIDSGVGNEEYCNGCLSYYCLWCMEAQNHALKQVEALMKRLEEAEYLFPSNKAFAELFPLYQSPGFVGRVKAISLWYNMTKHQRLKLGILGKLLSSLENKRSIWPLFNEDCLNENSSPSDSNNSSASSVNDYSKDSPRENFSVSPLTEFVSNKRNDSDVVHTPYRRYIENVLKTRALHKSLSFLDKLHKHVLNKAKMTLQKPAKGLFERATFNDEEELQRYGCWSPEAEALNLPSYRASFIFLSQIPLEVIHAYLQIRLEQKPENPSLLSMRQLMRELKEGLKIAITNRFHIIDYVQCAVAGTNEEPETYLKKTKEFDSCTLQVFSDYLNYLEMYTLSAHVMFQKNFLEGEYEFACEMIGSIPGSTEIVARTFSNILASILQSVQKRFIKGIDDLIETIPTNNAQIKQHLLYICRELQPLFNEERENCLKTIAFFRMILKGGIFNHELLKRVTEQIINFKCVIPKAIGKVQVIFEHISLASFDETDKLNLNSRIRELLMQGYRFGFEFYNEMSENAAPKYRERLMKSMVDFAMLWMKFVTERCERGRGMRPRWAGQGLEFLLMISKPEFTKYLSDQEFEDLQNSMRGCISHVIGTISPSTESIYIGSPRQSLEHIRVVRSRGNSPSPRPTYKSQRSASRKTSNEQLSPVVDQTDCCIRREDSCGFPLVKIKLPQTHMERCRDAIENLETEIDNKMRQQNLIGKVMNCNGETKTHIRRRYVNFSWQRGIKIGQGRFGKVYTAVNINTGEMMAVKEIPLQHNDKVTIKRVAEEMKILEGIHQRNLVRYYGVEVHKDEMLLFMEFCAEGTLETLVAATEKGLPELLVRQYTYQLVSGVAILHDHGIVHRDIKTANVFLTDEGNCLKIGDFGCAAKIKSNTTMPGELKGFVGTQAYMAPEVFTKNMTEGHGRAADIWSVGCVVVEMASGKRPWANFDSNYQIMFKVGTGQSPEPPMDMIDEGLDFLELCFKHDPKQRATAQELLTQNFCKIGDDL